MKKVVREVVSSPHSQKASCTWRWAVTVSAALRFCPLPPLPLDPLIPPLPAPLDPLENP